MLCLSDPQPYGSGLPLKVNRYSSAVAEVSEFGDQGTEKLEAPSQERNIPLDTPKEKRRA
jgi:hypothetical protein